MPTDESEKALNRIKSEAVTIKQLIYSITSEDLEEIGISSESRTAILTLAEVILHRFQFLACPVYLHMVETCRQNEAESR